MRFFKTGLEDGLVNKVSEYTNSQNTISGRDLKSVDKIQLDIEKRFDIENIKYLRKRTKDNFERKHKYEISMEKLGQLLLAYNGHPEKVSNSKKKIFEDYYNVLFNDKPDFMNISIELVKNYHAVFNKYKDLTDKYKYYEQKIFYIIYLNRCFEKNDIIKNILLLEEVLMKYRANEEISPARKLIQKGFKDELDKRIVQEGGTLISPITLNKK
ncbi:AIPR family protein [Campylobacter blaseri]|uniref:AIPR family protein n=1 Tax=Campylobacter blaseri TaxID=2042961 RepID=UPI001F4D9F6F|nr:AIPR family protein [Campylobacter blaseri]